MNLLLTLRQAAIDAGIDWFDPDSVKKVAGRLQEVAGGNQGYATIQLRAIKYMDAYLEDANAPGQYHKLLRQVERFRDIGKLMSLIEDDYQDYSTDMLQLVFAAVACREPSRGYPSGQNNFPEGPRPVRIPSKAGGVRRRGMGTNGGP